MATMMKEKRREKRKAKPKPPQSIEREREIPVKLEVEKSLEDTMKDVVLSETVIENTQDNTLQTPISVEKESSVNTSTSVSENPVELVKTEHQDKTEGNVTLKLDTVSIDPPRLKEGECSSSEECHESPYRAEIDRIKLLKLEQDADLSLSSASECTEGLTMPHNIEQSVESAVPSAPNFEEQIQPTYEEEIKIETVEPTLESMSLEAAINLFGGEVMAGIKAMSEREEAIVLAGPVSGPEHPLVDLLSTFRSSLSALDRQHTQFTNSYLQEEKYRETLWEVTKCTNSTSEKCSTCGGHIVLKVSYEKAEFQVSKLPVAKMKLESLLKDVQESYCHYQHEALLSHCQIEELVYQTITQGNKIEIREALALIFKALQLSDNGPQAQAIALKRWARALSAALLDGRDIRQLLYLLHHLFKQVHSVKWAAKVIRFNVTDRVSAAQAVAVMDILLAKPTLEAAQECIEGSDDWEEVGHRGCAGAVSASGLRERDLLAILQAFPGRALLATMVLWPHTNISTTQEQDFGDHTYGRGVLWSCCAVRALLHVVQRAIHAHPTYARLRAWLERIAGSAVHALAALHEHCEPTYSPTLRTQLSAELRSSFGAALSALRPRPQRAPAALLTHATARELVFWIMTRLHEPPPRHPLYDWFPLCASPCAVLVRVAAHAAVYRGCDHELARIVLEFVLQIGIKPQPVPCKGGCDVTARDALAQLLAAHPYLHVIALHIVAELSQAAPIPASSLQPLSIPTWRPGPDEVASVLNDWTVRCPQLIPHLLQNMDFRVHCGVPLPAQLSIGSWLCSQRPQPEWCWTVLMELRTHRTWWERPEHQSGLGHQPRLGHQGAWPVGPPDPIPDPGDLFGNAYAVLASEWGHSIPLICSHGISALRVVCARAPVAAHCLAPLMRVMADSTDSIRHTPQFAEVFTTLLSTGPSLVQRALGALGGGGPRGLDLLTKVMVKQIRDTGTPSILTAWSAGARLSAGGAALTERGLSLPGCARAFEGYAVAQMQEPDAQDFITWSVREVSEAPLVCAIVLKAAHTQIEAPALWPRLLVGLAMQKSRGERIHVDNALKALSVSITSDQLVINQSVRAVLSVGAASGPAHAQLWKLFMKLYLERMPGPNPQAVGPLLFSGLMKSRTLAQLRKKLQEIITYHKTKLETLKSKPSTTKTENSRNSPSEKSRLELLPKLSIKDFTGSSDSSDSSDEDTSASEKEDTESMSARSAEDRIDSEKMAVYHNAAVKMFTKFLSWLEEGSTVRALPYHADQEMSEQLLESTFLALPPPRPPRPPPPPRARSAYENARAAILRAGGGKRYTTKNLKSPVEVDVRDARALARATDSLLADLEALARDWHKDVSTIATLDSELWSLIRGLRVRRPLPAARRSCRAGCTEKLLCVQDEEWPISTGVQNGISRNRERALSTLRRLSRARPHAARIVAALHTTARAVREPSSAGALCVSAGRQTTAAGRCPPAAAAITHFVTHLVKNWLSNDGPACAALLRRWGASDAGPLQVALCGALAPPAAPSQRPMVYVALLGVALPECAVFSYLSKFDLPSWADQIPPSARRDMLGALLAAAPRWGRQPAAEEMMLLELLGVHTRTLITPEDIIPVVKECSRLSIHGVLPPVFWTHIVKAVEEKARAVPLEQLDHLMRELGAMWWEASKTSQEAFEVYSGPMMDLLTALLAALIGAAMDLSYAAERVCTYAWPALRCSWSAWVVRGTDAAVARLVHAVRLVMASCPGTEDYMLEQLFVWTVAEVGASEAAGALRAALGALPWGRQWIGEDGVRAALQACASGDAALQNWVANLIGALTVDTWMGAAAGSAPAPRLAALLYLFTSMTHVSQTLDIACRLPWPRLPEPALEEALDRFFAQYHSTTQPYHSLPQFRVLLSASELLPPPNAAPSISASSISKRGRCISQWCRAASSPALAHHVAAFVTAVLDVIGDLAPALSDSAELEELLGRAAAILCIEPAAAHALPVWESWSLTAVLPYATVGAAAALVPDEAFGTIADAAFTAFMNMKESPGWPHIRGRLAGAPRAVGPLAARGRLHAAYAVHGDPTAVMLALQGDDVDFTTQELIISLWLCVCARIAADDSTAGDAARGALRRAAAAPKGALQRLVTRAGGPTAKHRLLARLALCILSPNTETGARAYEETCTTILGVNCDAMTWARTPRPSLLPRLAIRLFPKHEVYFREELELVKDD